MSVNNNERFFGEFDYPDYNEWKSAAEKALKGAPFDKLMYNQTYEGITLKPIYNPNDLENLKNLADEFPGSLNYERHSEVTGYFKKDWEIAQNIPYPLPEHFNEAIKNDLANGQNSVKISFDRASALYEDFIIDDLSGYDTIIANLEHLETALNEVELDKFNLNIHCGTGAFSASAALFALLKKKGYDYRNIKGSLNYDIISDLVNDGQLNIDTNSLLDELSILTKWTAKNAPNFKSILINSSSCHNAGANAVQELACSLSSAVFIINGLLERGCSINDIAKNFVFNYSVGVNFFVEIAKLRAARLLWSKILLEYGADAENCKMYVSTETSYRDTTYYDVYVNLLRSTSETFASIMGGSNSITVRNFDELHGQPGEFSRRVSRNIQNVLKYESHLTDTIDPAGGSWYIESITYQLAEAAWAEFTKIEADGGIIKSLKNGTIQDKIEKIRIERLKNIASRKDIILGINKYANLNEKMLEGLYEIDFEAVENFLEKFETSLDNRDYEKLDNLLDNFENNFNTDNPEVFELAVEAILHGATIAELNNSIPSEAGLLKVKPLLSKRTSEPYEKLRENAEDYKLVNGSYPNLQFVCFGNLRDYKARAEFSNDFFQVGGFTNKIVDNNFTADDAIEKIKTNSENFFVVCSTDDIYSQVLVDFAQKLKETRPDSYLILAGYPKDKIDEYTSAGVDMFIHIKSDVLDTINKLQTVAGINKNSELE